MKKLIYNKVDKAMISQLKRVVYYGKIYVVTSAADAENIVDYLLSQPVLGLTPRRVPPSRKARTTFAPCCRSLRTQTVSSSA